MVCKNCEKQVPKNNHFCPFCLSQIQSLHNNEYHKYSPGKEPPKIDSKYAKEFVGHQTQNKDDIEKKIDEYINDMDKKQNNDIGFDYKIFDEKISNYGLNETCNKYINSIVKKGKNKPFIRKIQYFMKELHDYIIYDEQLKKFVETDIYKKNAILHDFYNNYKNHPEQVIINKKGTCVGFSNTFKVLCEKAGMKCQILEFHINQNNFHHALNIVYDCDKKYYVDCTWGFITDDFSEVKVNYQRDRIESSKYYYNKIEEVNSKDTNFMTIVFFVLFLIIVIVGIVSWLLK